MYMDKKVNDYLYIIIISGVHSLSIYTFTESFGKLLIYLNLYYLKNTLVIFSSYICTAL